MRIGGGGGDAGQVQSSSEIREHPFFSRLPMDSEEAAQHAAEHTERLRHQQAMEREGTRRSRSSGDPLTSSAGEIIRSLSISTGVCVCVCVCVSFNFQC